MIIKKLTQVTILSSVLSFSHFAQAQCAQQVEVQIGEISQQLTTIPEDHYVTPEMALEKKYDYAKDELANKTHVLNYTRTRANGNWRKCFYQSESNSDLKAELKQVGQRSVELKMTVDLEDYTSDNEFYIFDNQIVLTQTLSRSRSLRQGNKAFTGLLKSRNHYDYSCGFIDCTYTNDEIDPLANSEIVASWN